MSGSKRNPKRTESPRVHVTYQRVVRHVVGRIDRGVNVENRNLTTATVLSKLRVVDTAVMINDVNESAVFTKNQVCRISKRPAVQSDPLRPCCG